LIYRIFQCRHSWLQTFLLTLLLFPKPPSELCRSHLNLGNVFIFIPLPSVFSIIHW
jgi:hypothetical protein